MASVRITCRGCGQRLRVPEQVAAHPDEIRCDHPNRGLRLAIRAIERLRAQNSAEWHERIPKCFDWESASQDDYEADDCHEARDEALRDALRVVRAARDTHAIDPAIAGEGRPACAVTASRS